MPKILDGTDFVDSSLAEGGFNYFLYVKPGGSGIIMRGNIAATSFRFYFFRGASTQLERATNVQAQWDDRVNKGYIRPSNLGRQ